MSAHDSQRDELQAYLDGECALSKAYRESAVEQPPERLDAAILADARRCAHTLLHHGAAPFSRSWLVPASLAATVLLSGSLVFLIGEQQHQLDEPYPDIVEPVPGAPAVEPASGARGVETARPPVHSENVQRIQPSDTPPTLEPEPMRLMTTESEPLGRALIESAPADTVAPKRVEQSNARAPQITAEFLDHPRLWIDYVETLVSENRLDEARTQLRAFRRRYPDFVLPERLEALALAE